MDTMIYIVLGFLICSVVLCEAVRPAVGNPVKPGHPSATARWSPTLLAGFGLLILLIGFTLSLTARPGVQGYCLCNRCAAKRLAGTGGGPVCQKTAQYHWKNLHPEDTHKPLSHKFRRLMPAPKNEDLPTHNYLTPYDKRNFEMDLGDDDDITDTDMLSPQDNVLQCDRGEVGP